MVPGGGVSSVVIWTVNGIDEMLVTSCGVFGALPDSDTSSWNIVNQCNERKKQQKNELNFLICFPISFQIDHSWLVTQCLLGMLSKNVCKNQSFTIFGWRRKNFSHGSMASFVEGVCCELICTKKHLLSPNVSFSVSKACWALKIWN